MAFADIMTWQLEELLYGPCRDAENKGNTLRHFMPSTAGQQMGVKS